MAGAPSACLTGSSFSCLRPCVAPQPTTSSCWAMQVDLLLFYTHIGGGTLGESWSVYSYIQALGCAFPGLILLGKRPCTHHEAGERRVEAERELLRADLQHVSEARASDQACCY